jgi:malonyl-CoA decarboxylase
MSSSNSSSIRNDGAPAAATAVPAERASSGGSAGAGFFDAVIDRTLANLRTAWRDIADSARGVLGGGVPRPDLPRDDAERLVERMRDCLQARGGEVTARARAADLGRIYLALNPVGRERFLRLLAERFDVDRRDVAACCADLAAATDEAARRRAERAMRQALEPPRVRLLTQFNGLPEGVKFLVDMRAELMRLTQEDPLLASLEQDLKGLLASWFDIGFLELRHITWQAPAALLEKLIVYEAVHTIRSWADLKNRLDSDRRCFAFFHPRMPDEPLIFVEVALVDGMAGDVHALLDENAPVGDPTAATAAIFYSISNCQAGLAGISFGNFLIKRVVDQLAAELPRLKTFATLSPIPGFRAWLDRQLGEADGDLLLPAERKTFAALPGDLASLGIKGLLAVPRWHENEAIARALKEPLMRLCSRYLVLEQTPKRRALDPVAHFHLSNGARVERLNWLADRSPRGLQQSAGMMINYLYKLPEIDANHEAYTGDGRIAAASQIRAMANA